MKKFVMYFSISMIIVASCVTLSTAGPVLQQLPITKATDLTAGSSYVFRFSLWDAGPVGIGEMVWSEVKTIVVPASQTISHKLGSVTPFGVLDFSQQYWVQVERQLPDGGYAVIGGRAILKVAAYSLYSIESGGGGVTSINAGNGLTQNATTGNVTLNIGSGTGISVSSNTVGLDVAFTDPRYVNAGESNSVSTGMVLDGTIGSADIADGGIGSLDLASASVTGAKIAAGAVSNSKIISASVTRAKMSSITAIRVECNGACGDSTLGNICDSAALLWEPIGVACDEPRDGVSRPCGGDNWCTTVGYISRGMSLGTLCDDGGGGDAIVFCMAP